MSPFIKQTWSLSYHMYKLKANAFSIRELCINNEIMQEFNFAHPSTKMQLNCTYNTRFTGSVIWDLFSRESIMIENTWKCLDQKYV